MPLNLVEFGQHADGSAAFAFRLRSASLDAWFIERGASLVRLRAPDRSGVPGDVVLGFDAWHGYQQSHPYLGAVVGRHANRIRDARFPLDGRIVRLAPNDGSHHLHGGPTGLDRRDWRASVLDDGDSPAIEFAVHSEDGDQGYPGALEARVCYRLDGARLQIDYLAASTAPTPVNLTQHAYLDLSGNGDIRGHQLQLAADRYLPVDAGLIPTGELRPVDGTPFDFRGGASIGERLQALASAEPESPGFDHCFVLQGSAGRMRPALRLSDPASGRSLRLLTDQPGLQLYTGNFLDGSLLGRGGRALQRHAGVCLEAQGFPDAPNQPRFPDAILRPGAVYRQSTVLEFSAA